MDCRSFHNQVIAHQLNPTLASRVVVVQLAVLHGPLEDWGGVFLRTHARWTHVSLALMPSNRAQSQHSAGRKERCHKSKDPVEKRFDL